MKALFSPAIALMNRLTYPLKLGLIGAVSFVAIALLLILLSTQLSRAIDDSQTELRGIEVIEPMLVLAQRVQQHRGLTAGALGGNSQLKEQVPGKEAEVASSIQNVDAVENRLGKTLQFSREWGDIKAHWERIHKGWPNMTLEENLREHGALVEELLLMNTLVAESSRLILDTDIDSYYLMDIVVGPLPELLERMGKLRAAGTGILARKEISEQGRYDFAARIAVLERVQEDLKHNLGRAAQANRDLGRELTEFSKTADVATGSVVSVIRDEVLPAHFVTSPEAYYGRATEAINGGYKAMTETLIPALKGLIEARVTRLQSQFYLSLGVTLLVLLSFAYLAAGTYLSVISSIRRMREGASRVASGDLSAQIEIASRDELGEVAAGFNAMTDSLRGLIGKIQADAANVSAASTTLATSSAQIQDGSERQSESAAHMAAAVEQTTIGVDQIAAHAREAHTISTESGEISTQGQQVVARTVEEMTRIADVVTHSAQLIEELGRRSDQISTIVSAIKGIADQTNLLALNAAIEAARAGDAGRGFAVVADEVRELAERTTRSTQDISEMIDAIQEGIVQAVDSMRAGVASVSDGVTLAQRAGETMEKIKEGSERVVRSISDISTALREQSAASSDIAKNVERIAQMAEENSAAVAETASTAKTLESLAAGLQEEARRYRINA